MLLLDLVLVLQVLRSLRFGRPAQGKIITNGSGMPSALHVIVRRFGKNVTVQLGMLSRFGLVSRRRFSPSWGTLPCMNNRGSDLSKYPMNKGFGVSCIVTRVRKILYCMLMIDWIIIIINTFLILHTTRSTMIVVLFVILLKWRIKPSLIMIIS